MIAIHCPDRERLHIIQSALPERVGRVGSVHWPEFARAAARAACSVILIERLADNETVPDLLALRRRLPFHPVVLVTSSDPENSRLLVGLPVEQVVWISAIEKMLEPAVERACTRGLLQRVADAVEAAEHLPVRLREALALACRSEPPVHTLATLARRSGCDRRTLWLSWRTAFPVPPFRLEDFLDWLLLFHAAGRKTPGRSWAAVADELYLHRQTLSLLARRVMGLELRDLAAGGRDQVARRFEREVLRLLLGGRGFDLFRRNWTFFF